jgi:hypothetical protein
LLVAEDVMAMQFSPEWTITSWVSTRSVWSKCELIYQIIRVVEEEINPMDCQAPALDRPQWSGLHDEPCCCLRCLISAATDWLLLLAQTTHPARQQPHMIAAAFSAGRALAKNMF